MVQSTGKERHERVQWVCFMTAMPHQDRPRRIAVVSSSRADLAHLIHPLRTIQADPGLELVVMATGALLQQEYGHGVNRLHAEGFTLVAVDCPLEIEHGRDAAHAIGKATCAFADVLDELQPDLLVIIADRFEMLAPASAALAMRIPIAHIEGGERSEGAIDDAVRNALTKMSHLHMVTTSSAMNRILSMGEEPWRVHRVGAASLDHLHKSDIPDRAMLESELGCTIEDRLLLVGMHPVTLQEDQALDTRAVVEALGERDEQVIFCFPNADEGNHEVRRVVESFVAGRESAHMVTNLPPESWFGLLHHAGIFIGNSSSVLMESPSIPIPAICVGSRQDGRERAENVIDVPPVAREIVLALEEALDMDVAGIENPYGTGDASGRIRDVLLEAPSRSRLLAKRTTILDT